MDDHMKGILARYEITLTVHNHYDPVVQISSQLT